MKLPSIAIVLATTVLASNVPAQEPRAGRDEARQLRVELQKAEAELQELTARLKQLKERLAKIEGQNSSQPQAPTALRFPFEIERAMLFEAIPSRGISPQRDNGTFFDGKGGPGHFGPAPMPRR